MSHASFSKEHILNYLDVSAAAGHFPILDNGYVYLIDTRLSAYGNHTRWALLIEVLGMDVRFGEHDSIENHVYYFGNCIDSSAEQPHYLILHPTADGLEGSTFAEDNVWEVRALAQTIRIRDIIIPIHADPSVFAARGITLVKPPCVMAVDLLRSLALDYRDLLFATEDELHQLIPTDLPRLIRLDAWNHPDIAAEEKPSDNITFQMLADVLVSSNPACYHPRVAPNTHWINWPDAGTL